MSPARGETTTGGARTKRKLIDKARSLIEDDGLGRATLRKIAQGARISPMAVYRHFPEGRPEMLAVVAQEGFREMIDFVRSGRTSPEGRIIDVPLRYVRFGVEKPNLYRALFSEELADPLASYSDWEASGTISGASAEHYRALDLVKLEAFDVITNAIADGLASEAPKPGDLEDFGLALAALVHGLVGEFIDEGLYRQASRDTPWSAERKRMSRRVIELMVAGFRASQNSASANSASVLAPDGAGGER